MLFAATKTIFHNNIIFIYYWFRGKLNKTGSLSLRVKTNYISKNELHQSQRARITCLIKLI